ncbi:chitinase, partial [Streptomyces sp. NPDC003660]
MAVGAPTPPKSGPPAAPAAGFRSTGAAEPARARRGARGLFVLAPNGGGCSPTWGGISPVSSDTAV